MTTTLLLRLAGPMQSWGTQSRFGIRDTGLEPSKSGVVGLLCAALGWERWREVDDLARLRMGVRVERPGVVRTDYHTVGGGRIGGRSYGVPKANRAAPETAQSWRQYLSDADFLVGLEARPEDSTLLDEVATALRRPRWQLFLGRKTFVPGVPVWLPPGAPWTPRTSDDEGWGPWPRDGRLDEVLREYPWVRERDRARFGRAEEAPPSWRVVLEVPEPESGSEARMDQPHGRAFETRRFLPRHVTTEFWRGIRVVDAAWDDEVIGMATEEG